MKFFNLLSNLNQFGPQIAQIAQPKFKRLFRRFNFGFWLWFNHTTKLFGSTMSKQERAKRSSSANECPARRPAEGMFVFQKTTKNCYSRTFVI